MTSAILKSALPRKAPHSVIPASCIITSGPSPTTPLATAPPPFRAARHDSSYLPELTVSDSAGMWQLRASCPKAFQISAGRSAARWRSEKAAGGSTPSKDPSASNRSKHLFCIHEIRVSPGDFRGIETRVAGNKTSPSASYVLWRRRGMLASGKRRFRPGAVDVIPAGGCTRFMAMGIFLLGDSNVAGYALRVSCRLEIEWGSAVSGSTRDISTGGMFIEAAVRSGWVRLSRAIDSPSPRKARLLCEARARTRHGRVRWGGFQGRSQKLYEDLLSSPPLPHVIRFILNAMTRLP